MKILAIETSCDDTCISIIKASGNPSPLLAELRRARKKLHFDILSNIVSSQVEIHKKWGGVYPTMAKREHQRNLLPVLTRALKQSKLIKISNSQFLISNKNLNSKCQKLKKILEREKYLSKKIEKFLKKYQKPKVDLIAITIGPGLDPCLWTGVNFARAIAFFWDIPIITVNHIKAHIFVNVINKKPLTKKDFPAVCLIVSGGNTQVFLMKDFGKYKILGETRDDAAGECFDKTARILGLDYPGGPAIAREAAKYKIQDTKYKIQFPRPMINQKNYDFSFSGLKTAVLYKYKKTTKKLKKDKKYIQAMCAEIQQAVIDVSIKKTIKAAVDYKIKTIILGGGVTANKELRKQFKEKIKKDIPDSKLYIPDSKLCTDNAVMVAIAGYFRWKKIGKSENWQDIKTAANLKIC